MKLLIVVSKLLTGFDAPSCTYIYLDNELRDHNLFQAICRTNRLDGDDKDYGHIVDFKELFGEVQEGDRRVQLDELDTDPETAATTTSTSRTGLVEGKKRLDEPRGAALPVRAGAAAARSGAVPALLLRRCGQPERA
jgi:type I restriction enzyme R subunit